MDRPLVWSVVAVRIVHALLFVLAAGYVPAATSASVTPPDHPLLGTWAISSKDGSCVETYRFRADGTANVTSGAEVAVIAYEIAPAPSSRGFYRWKHKIVQDNGKRDCSGKTMTIGDESVWFVQFDAGKQRMIICNAESTAACFGPLARKSDRSE